MSHILFIFFPIHFLEFVRSNCSSYPLSLSLFSSFSTFNLPFFLYPFILCKCYSLQLSYSGQQCTLRFVQHSQSVTKKRLILIFFFLLHFSNFIFIIVRNNLNENFSNNSFLFIYLFFFLLFHFLHRKIPDNVYYMADSNKYNKKLQQIIFYVN